MIGPVDCGGECGFIYNDEKQTHMMFTEPGNQGFSGLIKADV